MTKNIIVVFFILAAFFVFWSGSKPLYKKIKATQNEETDLKNFLQKIREIRVLRDDLLSGYNAISSADLKRLKKIIPLSPEKEILIAQFENLATARNLNLKSVEIAQSQKNKNAEEPQNKLKIYETIDISLSLSGSYKDFLNFIKDIEENLRIIDFEEIAFGTDNKGIYEFSAKAKTYYSPLEIIK